MGTVTILANVFVTLVTEDLTVTKILMCAVTSDHARMEPLVPTMALISTLVAALQDTLV